ncbi:MAG: hypothetical protein ACFE7E_06680 [Candidatus Hodarchaeota archaeon]
MVSSAALWLIIGLGLIIFFGIALIQTRPVPESDAVLGPLLFLWGFFNFEIAFGLFKMKRRAWILAVISTLIGLSFAALGIDIFTTEIWGILYVYELKTALLVIGVFQLLYLLFSYGNFRKD